MSVKDHDPRYPSPYVTGGGAEKPLSEHTAGRKFRVRDSKGTKVWSPPAGLPYEQALKLKEKVCGERKSTSAIIEDMSVPLAGHVTAHAVHGAPVPVAPGMPGHPSAAQVQAQIDAAASQAYEQGKAAARAELEQELAARAAAEAATAQTNGQADVEVDEAALEDIANDAVDLDEALQ